MGQNKLKSCKLQRQKNFKFLGHKIGCPCNHVFLIYRSASVWS